MLVDFTFRLLTKEDFPLLMVWLHRPHVMKWWRDPQETMDQMDTKYGGRILGTDPTDVYIAQLNGTPIGLIQSYWNHDYPEHAATIQLADSVGVDLFIGELDFIGKGYGPAMIQQFIEQVIRPNYPTARYVVSDPEIANHASVRAFQKAGFRKGAETVGEYGPEQLMILDL